MCSISRHRLSAADAKRISKGRGFALDVMGGVKQGFLVGLAETADYDGVAGLSSRSHSDIHPAAEFARQLGQRLFGARDRISSSRSGATC